MGDVYEAGNVRRIVQSPAANRQRRVQGIVAMHQLVAESTVVAYLSTSVLFLFDGQLVALIVSVSGSENDGRFSGSSVVYI